MNASEYASLVERKIQDASFSQDDILVFFNECLGETASIVVLPDLTTFGTVTCVSDSNSVAMPSNFHSHLFHVYNSTKSCHVRIFDKLTEMLDRQADVSEAGTVERLALEGNTLFYQGIPPSEETLQVCFSRQPTLFSDITDDVETVMPYIPKHFRKQLLVNYAVAEIFNEIEDGADGAKVNTNKYRGRFEIAVKKLQNFVGLPMGNPSFVYHDPEPSLGFFE